MSPADGVIAVDPVQSRDRVESEVTQAARISEGPLVPPPSLSRFNLAFALMSVIPLLIAFYLVTVRFFSLDILIGLNGVYFLFAVAFSLLGLLVGRRIIQETLQQLVAANVKSEQLLAELTNVNEQLRTSKSSLERSHEELRDAHLQLMQATKMESVGRLAAGVAHEVKNPLAIILAGVELLPLYLKDPDQRVETILRDIVISVNRADDVVKGLLNFSSPQELQVTAIDLNDIVEQALALVRHELVKSHVNLTKQFGTPLRSLRLDSNKIQQVFINLFMNALHAMPEGGTLTVTTYGKQLREVGNRVGNRRTDRFRVGEEVVVAEVEDTGSGIHPDKLPKIFDPFFTTKPPGKGTGLGLTVTQTIIELHGGTIDITNRPQGGVQVRIMFPVEIRNSGRIS